MGDVINSKKRVLAFSSSNKRDGGLQPEPSPVMKEVVRCAEVVLDCSNVKIQGMGIESPLYREMELLALNAAQAFQDGLPPILIEECTGGAYYLRSPTHRISAVFKPLDEEPYALNNPKSYIGDNIRRNGIKRGVPVGEAAIRECAAYLLDTDGHARVPKTIMAEASHPKFHIAQRDLAEKRTKVGSLQEYCTHDCSAEDLGSSMFPIDRVHAIGILDIRLGNQDRHPGNILVRFNKNKESSSISSPTNAPMAQDLISTESSSRIELIPIDHGCCLPSFNAMDETSFVWLSWSQSKVPFSASELQRIEMLDSMKEVKVLKEQLGEKIEPDAILTLHIGTALLKIGARLGLTLHSIGSIMCREKLEHPSALEVLINDTLNALNGRSWTHEVFLHVLEPILEKYILSFTLTSGKNMIRRHSSE